MNPLQGLYQVGLNLDRALTQRVRLSHPVISVGNISVGGRAKTPMVMDLCAVLKERGYTPVVLTRGYGRKSRKDVWLLPEVLPHIQNIRVDDCGDEAVEIFLQAKVAVLISAERSAQAQKFAARYQDQRLVFILDDGFQHWKLERDLDVVLLDESDLGDSLLPTGRLREKPAALERANLVLQLGRDVHKRMELPLTAKGLDPSVCVAITTRAGSQKAYFRELEHHLGFAVTALPLSDHLSPGVLQDKISGLPSGARQLLVGMKEAVKLLPPAELLEPPAPFYSLKIKGRSFEIYIVNLKLEWNREVFTKLLGQKVFAP